MYVHNNRKYVYTKQQNIRPAIITYPIVVTFQFSENEIEE